MKTTSKLGIFLAVSLPIAGFAAVASAFPFGRSWMEPADGINNPAPDQPAGRAAAAYGAPAARWTRASSAAIATSSRRG